MTFKALVWQTGSNIESCEVRWAIALRFWQGWAITKHRSPHHRKILDCNSEHQYWRETAGLLRAAPRPKAEKSACQVCLITATGANHGAQTLCGRLRARDRSGPYRCISTGCATKVSAHGVGPCVRVCVCAHECGRAGACAAKPATAKQQLANKQPVGRCTRARADLDRAQTHRNTTVKYIATRPMCADLRSCALGTRLRVRVRKKAHLPTLVRVHARRRLRIFTFFALFLALMAVGGAVLEATSLLCFHQACQMALCY